MVIIFGPSIAYIMPAKKIKAKTEKRGQTNRLNSPRIFHDVNRQKKNKSVSVK